MHRLKTADKAPDFRLSDQDGKEVSLSDFRGKKVLLYFYPKADTPGCTKQACSIRDNRPDLSSLGIDVLGISPDQPEKQAKFDQKYNLGFQLLSDTDHRTAEAYGVWGEKKNYGKTYHGIVRSSFLIGEDGSVIQAWYKVKPEETVQKVMGALNVA